MTDNADPTFGVGHVLGESLRALIDNLLPFLAVALLLVSPVYMLVAWLVWEGEFILILHDQVLELGLTAAEVLLGFITHAAVVYGTFRYLQGQRPSFSESVTNGLRGAAAVILVSLVSGLVVVLGLAFFVIPGAILATMFWIAVPAAVAEKTGIIDSLGRSEDLTAGYRWKVFGIILVVIVIQTLTDRLIERFLDFDASFYMSLGLAWVISATFTAFAAVVCTVTYYHLRRVKEGSDVDEIAAVFD